MRLSILQKSNITIMAVAAVVIVVCLLGSWAYMDDEDDAGFRDPVIGDYDTFIMTVSYVDGQSVNHRYTSTLTAIWDDGTRSYYSLYDDGSSYTWDSEFSGNWADFSTLELIGEETVDSPVFGPVDCEVYLSEEYGQMYWFNPDYPNFVKIERTYDDGSVETTYLQDSTQFGDAPEFTALDTRGPVPGDYSIYEMYGSDGHIIGSYAYYVNSVEDGMVWYEIFDDGTGLTVSDVCPVEEYIWSPSEYGEHVAVTLVRSDMGTFLCDVYQYTAVDTVLIYMVDSTTGVLCMIENHASGETYSEVLTYSTHVSSEWAYEGLREADAGDYGAYSYITGNAEGVTGCGTVFMEVETVYDGTPSVTVVGDGISERMDWYPIFTMEKYEAVGTETVCTYYGDLVCDVVVTESADVTMTYLVHDGVVHRERADFSDGTWIVMDTVFNTVLEHPPSPDESFIADPEVGDRLLYHMYVDNIYHSDVTMEIVSAGDGVYELSLAGGDTMTVTEDRLLSGEWMTDGFEFRGNAYLETDNGYRYMDVYTGEFEEGKVTVFVGSDGVPYFVNCTLSDGTKYMLDFADASWVY